MRLSNTLVPLLAAGFLALPGTAQTNDAKELTTPTGWWVMYDTDINALGAKVKEGFRVIDIKLLSWGGNDKVAAVLVKNSGAYYDKSPSHCVCGGVALEQSPRKNNRRVISLSAYPTTGGVGYASAQVDNSGPNAKKWDIEHFGSSDDIDAWLRRGNWRLLDIDGHKSGVKKRYSVVVVENTGDAKRDWTWLKDTTVAGIEAKQRNGGWHPYHISRNSWGTYNAIFIKKPLRFWWTFKATQAQLDEVADDREARLTSLDFHSSFGKREYIAVFNNNKNALSTKIADQLEKGSKNRVGFLLKKVGGSTLASFHDDDTFDAEASITMLHSYSALDVINKTWQKLSTSVAVPKTMTGTCPDNKDSEFMTFEQCLVRAMRNGDNRAIEGVKVRVGGSLGLTKIAGQLGMLQTAAGAKIGCRALTSKPSLTTLRDNEKILAAVNAGKLAPLTSKFYEVMRQDPAAFPPKPWFNSKGSLVEVVTWEGNVLAYSSGRIQAFLDRIQLDIVHGKTDLAVGRARSYVARMALPFVVGGKIRHTEYLVGMFSQGGDGALQIEIAMTDASRELVRGEVRKALASWKDFGLGGFETYGKAPCIGSNAKQPWNFPAGTPVIGNLLNYTLQNGVPKTITLFTLGLSKTAWGKLPLPIAMDVFGAKNCKIYTEPTLQTAYLVGLDGSRAVAIQIPKSADLIGLHFYTQFWNLDKKANALGMTYSTAVDTTIGG